MGYKKTKIHPYKSTLEYKVSKKLFGFTYEPSGLRVPYSINHYYIPDFVHPDQKDVLLEVKGYLIKGHADCQKYIAVARDNPDKELIFIFSDPNKKAYGSCKIRKDGTFLTLGEWAKKNNILYFTPESIPESITSGLWGVEEVRKFKEELYS